MTDSEFRDAFSGCTRFLGYHTPVSLADQLRAIADSPYAALRRDRYGSGGFVAELEREMAELLGKETALFLPSGTMAQQIALRIWADEAGCPTVAFHPTCHLEIYEQNAYRELHRLDAILLGEADRLFTLADLEKVERPVSTLLIELPQREIGGQLPAWDDLLAVCAAARARGMRLHVDGARLWECGPFYGRSYAQIVAPFDSVYVSCYKILDGLPGAILAGPRTLIDAARVWQRRHGGNLVNQAPSAIAAKLGMERHLPRIPEYVARAGQIARRLRRFPQVRIVPELPPTNMMHLYVDGDPARLDEAGLRIMREDRVFLLYGAGKDGRHELTVGSATLELGIEEIDALFEKLFALAG